MAIFRKVHTQIWSDPFFSELENEKKIFYLYILTNERTRQCGIYEISKKHMAFDLGISIEKVSNLIKFFSKCGKIHFSDTTNEIAVKNWAKYNYSTSPKVVKCIESELCNVKNRVLIEYIYSIDSVSQEEEEKEEEQEQKEEKKLTVNVQAFVEWFNNMKLKHKGVKGKVLNLNKTDLNNLTQLKKDGYTSEDFEHSFICMCNSQWVQENNMATPSHFLRNENFIKYLHTELPNDKFKAAWQ
jgi:hypothetical protein